MTPNRTVKVIRTDAQRALADQYASAHPEASVYHLPAWRQIFGALGYSCEELLVQSRGTVTGFLRMFLVRTPLGRRLVAIPFRDRGGPLWDDPESLELLLEQAFELAREQSISEVVFKSVQPFPQAVVERVRLRAHHHWVRSSIDLRQRTRSQFFSDIGAKTRNMIRQAERAGLTLEQVSDPVTRLGVWHHLHLATQQELGVPAFPRRFFAAMFDQLAPAGNVHLYLVRRQGDVLAGCIVLRHGRTALYGYSASYPQQRQHRPNDFMLFNAIAGLMDGGTDTFDLGSDAPTQESLLFFKRKWLALQQPIPTYVAGGRTASLRDSSDPCFRLVRQAVRRLPRPLYRLLGSVVTRYLG